MKIKLLSLLIVSNLSAQSIVDGITQPASGLWGIGVKAKESPYINTDTQVSVAPYIFGSYGVLNIEANRADITLYGNGLIYSSIVGQYRSQEARNSDSSLGERKAALELGLQVGIILPLRFTLRSSYMYDVSNAHNGAELDTQLFRHDSWGKLFLLSSVGVQYQSSNLTNYYYATNNYTLDEAFSAEIEFIATYNFGKYGIFLGTRNYFYADEITDSPIVSQGYNLQVFSGVGYNF